MKEAMPRVAPVADWTPPEGMSTLVASGWRTFYRHIYQVYGVTPLDYRALYLAQLGRCYICQRAKGMHPDDPKGGGGRRLGVDHNHVLGNRREAVRGLLCNWGDKSCNRTIGYLNIESLQRAVDYVRYPPGQRVLMLVTDGVMPEDLQGVAFDVGE